MILKKTMKISRSVMNVTLVNIKYFQFNNVNTKNQFYFPITYIPSVCNLTFFDHISYFKAILKIQSCKLKKHCQPTFQRFPLSFMLINKTLRLNNLKTRRAMNPKSSVFVICVETIIYCLLYNLHECTFNYCLVCISINLWYKKKIIRKLSYLWSKFHWLHLFHF